jgi:hypothetical protein
MDLQQSDDEEVATSPFQGSEGHRCRDGLRDVDRNRILRLYGSRNTVTVTVPSGHLHVRFTAVKYTGTVNLSLFQDISS